MATAEVVVEGEYETGAQEQLYIEPNGMIATANAADGVTVWGSMQCPYYIHKALRSLFDLPADKVRVVQMETGGGFGGKEEYPSIIACHAALLAWKSGKPVKIIYDRAEDMVATTKRHPSRTRHRTAVTRDGRLVAMDIDFVIDGGAYARCRRSCCRAARFTRRDRTCARTCACAGAPWRPMRRRTAPSAASGRRRASSRSSGTWTASPPPSDLAPDELRRRNFIRAGRHERRRPGDDAIPSTWRALLDRALAITDYHAKRARFDQDNPSLRVRKGIGLATFMHGAGFTGSGEDHLASVVAVEATADGRVRVLSSSTEIGQGTNTIFAQIAADALGIAIDDDRDRAARHVDRAQQRSDRGVAHLHGGRQARRNRGARAHHAN